MSRKFVSRTTLLLLAITSLGCREKKTLKEETITKPNIVYILADDLGYGDVSANYTESKIKTPNIDRLTSEGMRFTNAHSPSSVCTPTRYGILTGRYPWRTKLPTGVLRGYGEALLEKDRTTIASFLKKNGYTTGVVGKWHLGLDWVIQEKYKDSINENTAQINEFGTVTQLNGDWIDFSKKPTDGPLNHGFDYSYILPASLDMPPYCYLEDDKLVAVPDAYTPGNDLDTGYYGAFWRAGRMAPGFKFEKVLTNFTAQAEEFIEKQSNGKEPFFLYFALAAPHTPWIPTDEYKNTSKAGQYGDFVQMVDATVGMISKKLQEENMTENTILIFTSDNGPYWRPDKIEEFAHRAAGPYRGMKADIYEGGHRVPFIVRWPGKVEAGSTSDVATTLTNLISTCSDLLHVPLGDGTGEDSQSILPILFGEEAVPEKKLPAVHHSAHGFFAIRKGDWKLIEHRGSGGFTEPISIVPKPGEPSGQLYNLANDSGETLNLYDDEPKVREELLKDLDSIKNL